MRKFTQIKKLLSSVSYWVVCIFLLLNLHCINASDRLHKQILTHLPQNDREILEKFLKVLLTNSEVGYILYGNKPICFQSISSGDTDSFGTMGHHMSTLLNNGLAMWEKVGLPKNSPKFILHIYQTKNLSIGWQRILVINRSAYYRAVNENLVLFKYVLGPELTAESLLEQLISPSTDFYAVLKNDKVLVGILLGFGANNALFVNREELLREHSDVPTHLTPSFGYSSLEEEAQDLKQKVASSSQRLEKYYPRLYFGHVPNDDKTVLNNSELVKDYEDVQKKIQEVLISKPFLENVLEKFYE